MAAAAPLPDSSSLTPTVTKLERKQKRERKNAEIVRDVDGLPPTLTKDQLALLAHCTRRTIERYIAKGQLQAFRPIPRGGGRVLIRREEALRFLGAA